MAGQLPPGVFLVRGHEETNLLRSCSSIYFPGGIFQKNINEKSTKAYIPGGHIPGGVFHASLAVCFPPLFSGRAQSSHLRSALASRSNSCRRKVSKSPGVTLEVLRWPTMVARMVRCDDSKSYWELKDDPTQNETKKRCIKLDTESSFKYIFFNIIPYTWSINVDEKGSRVSKTNKNRCSWMILYQSVWYSVEGCHYRRVSPHQ